jgi:hypothetical protein
MSRDKRLDRSGRGLTPVLRAQGSSPCGKAHHDPRLWQTEFCGGDGYFEHDCFDDSCCCLDPEDDTCHYCDGGGSIPICLSSPEWCEAHPLPGRENTPRNTPEYFVVGNAKEDRNG